MTIEVLLSLLGTSVIGIKGIVKEHGNYLVFVEEITINVRMNLVGISLGLTTITVQQSHSRTTLLLKGKEKVARMVINTGNIRKDIIGHYYSEMGIVNVYKLLSKDKDKIKASIPTNPNVILIRIDIGTVEVSRKRVQGIKRVSRTDRGKSIGGYSGIAETGRVQKGSQIDKKGVPETKRGKRIAN